MFVAKHTFFLNLNISITTILVVVVMFVLFPSCVGKKKELGKAITERDSLPVMASVDVSTFISDSGVTRYRIDAAEWLIYDRKDPSYWAFERGAYLEQFDSLMETEASVKADTAYYYDRKELWKLIGDVNIQNQRGEHFKTELLFWDQRKRKVYSDKKITMTRVDGQIINGCGFESDERFLKPVIHNISGIFYINQENKESVSTDSVD